LTIAEELLIASVVALALHLWVLVVPTLVVRVRRLHLGAAGLALPGVVFLVDPSDGFALRHELAHQAQMRRFSPLGVALFLGVHYGGGALIVLLVRRRRPRLHALWARNPLEREANARAAENAPLPRLLWLGGAPPTPRTARDPGGRARAVAAPRRVEIVGEQLSGFAGSGVLVSAPKEQHATPGPHLLVEGPNAEQDMKHTEMMSLEDVLACLPEGLLAITTSLGWHSILNSDGTHLGTVVPEDRVFCFDVGLYSARADAQTAEEIEELRERLELVLEDLILPAWRTEEFRLDTVEECAVAGSGWWHIVARLQADFATPADLKSLLAYAMSNVDAIGSTIDGTGVAGWRR